MSSSLKLYSDDSGPTISARLKIWDALHQADVSAGDTERILAFYASDIQKIAIPPPPLPPRTSTLDSKSEELFKSAQLINTRPPLESTIFGPPALFVQPKAILDVIEPAELKPEKGVALGPDCRFLVVATPQYYRTALIIHSYLEYLRVWTANTGGPWIFHSVKTVNLQRYYNNVLLQDREAPYWLQSEYWKTDFGPSSVGKSVSKISADLDTSSKKPHKLSHILDTLHGHKIPVATSHDFKGVDYVLVWDGDYVQSIEQLLLEAQKFGLSADNQGRKEDEGRIIRIPEWANPASIPDSVIKQRAITKFLERTFRWKCPEESITGGPFRTRFMTVKILRYYTKFELDNVLSDTRLKSGCRLYWTTHPCEKHHRIVAIVGTNKTLPTAQERLCEFLS